EKAKKDADKVDENDLAAILYTSGTTGHSKGVMLSHKNIVTNALSTFKNVTIVPEDVFLSVLPLAHTFECTVGMLVPLLHGSSVVYVDKTPTPSVLLKAFDVVKPTMMLSVPLIIEKIYKNKILTKLNGSTLTKTLYKFSFTRKTLNKIAGKKLLETFGGKLRFFGIGGAPLAKYVEEFLLEGNFPYVIGYGLTETAPLIAGTRLGMPLKLGSTGLAMPGVEVLIKEKNPETGEGEIAVKSPSVMLGYYKDEEKTKEVFDENGYFLTGDLGLIDEDGYLFISGRSKNLILGPSGENIYPEQIESIINQNETVLDSLVLQKEGKLVARIHLDYELIDKMFKANVTPDDVVKQKIDEHLEHMRVEINTKLASFSKITKYIEQVEPFIKTPTKKIKRYLYTE
ncbi:MAG: AMP-binding protein, partial [Sulfurimonas sp.]